MLSRCDSVLADAVHAFDSLNFPASFACPFGSFVIGKMEPRDSVAFPNDGLCLIVTFVADKEPFKILKPQDAPHTFRAGIQQCRQSIKPAGVGQFITEEPHSCFGWRLSKCEECCGDNFQHGAV